MRIFARDLLGLAARVALAWLIVFAYAASSSRSQSAGSLATSGLIQVTKPDSPLEPGGSDLPLTEPYTAVDPTNPDHLVVGSIVAPTTDEAPWRCGAFTSFDGGESWRRHDFDMERCIDPWINFLIDGTVLFTGIEIEDGHEGAERFHMVQYRSSDEGRTWADDPISLGRTHDHGILAVDRRSGAIFLTSQRTAHPEANPYVYLGRSEDSGLTWTDLRRAGSDSMVSKPTGLSILPDGGIFVSYEESIPDWDSAETVFIRGIRSDDGGATFTPPAPITEGCDVGHSGFPGYPFLDIDRSSQAYNGRLYHACILPDLGGVGIAHSTNLGRSWSGLVRVDSSSSTAYTRTPMLAVNGDGVVGVAWYDRRRDPDRRCQDVYFTASLDGGETFLPDQRVSTVTSCPDSPGNGRAARSWPMGGDYSSLAAGPDGTFHLVWADSRSGRFQLHHAAIRVDAN